jgi:hypothetical protein
MPDDWARLARAIATSNSPFHPDPALLWDIHDEFSPAGTGDIEIHGAQSSCPHNTTDFRDSVDDCGFASPFGPFSRVWQGFTNPTLGPFDPQRAGQTLLSDGVLDSGDAPMPAARVDFGIAPNTGGISGVGSLFPILKFETYRRSSTTDSTTGTNHPFYGPFYAFWIPPAYPSIASGIFGTLPPLFLPEASGITGPVNLSRDPGECNGSVLINGIAAGGGNNFNGYLACGLYIPWLFAKTLQCGATGALVDPNNPFGLGCEPTGATPVDCPPFVAGTQEPLTGADQPFRAQRVVVYTDEHGEARVQFVPGAEFFFGNLPIVRNANGGCDLAGINVLGTADVTATVRYPGEPVTARPVNSNTVTKTVTSAFAKTLQCFPKGPGAQNAVAAICVAQALDITGNPFVGETICFVADFNASDIQHFVGTINGITIGDAGRNAAAEAQGLRRICPFTDANGRAAVEVFNSNPTTVDVTAFFVDEGILRSLKVQFPITAPTAIADGTQAPQTTPTPTGGTTPTTQPNTNTNTNTQPNTSRPGVTYRIAKLRLVRQTRVKAYALVRVTGPAGTVRLRFRIAARNGRATTAIRTVRTGRLVTVPNLRTPRVRGALRVSASIVS